MLEKAYLVFTWFRTMAIETPAALNIASGQTPRKIKLPPTSYYKLISSE